MKASPNLMIETAQVYAPTEDGHWLPGAALGTLRVELVERTALAGASAGAGAELSAARLTVARCHRSSLPQAGRFLFVRGRYYRIEMVVEERDGYLRYQSMTLKETQ